MSKITESARDARCEIRMPGCKYPVEGIVWVHSNALRHGKGMGKKSMDIFGAYGCQYCHDIYDRRLRPPIGVSRDEVDACFQSGHDHSLKILIKIGLVVII